jgi:16S rRNA (guanine527-N7)-methyltransferase
VRLLEAEGIAVPSDAGARLAKHCALIREWHSYLSLVSTGDLPLLEQIHVPDSLSLAALVQRYGADGLLDIGPGGGYPAVPLAVVLPDVQMVLVERSVKKVGFLQKVCAALELKNVHLVHGEFPRAVEGIGASVVTARAVENPAKLTRALLQRVSAGAVYLCQSGLLRETVAETILVSPVEDLWKTRGLRRGDLRVVRLG